MSLTLNDYINKNLVHSIHTTERRSFRGCRRRWDWIFHEGYYPQVTPKPLEFGIAYHKAMEVWYDPTTWGINRDAAIAMARQTFVKECDAQKKAYLEKVGQRELDEEANADYDERKALGLGMLSEYAKISMRLDTNFRPIFVEKAFEVPILGPNGETIWCKCKRCFAKWQASEEGKAEIAFCQTDHVRADGTWWGEDDYKDSHWQGLPVTYGGRIDCLFEDLDMRYWIVDWKTAARLATGEPGASDDFLYLDDQITSYCWAFAIHLKVDVAGFIYHEQKKAYPVEPEPMKVARLGCMFSKNKNMDCDADTYERTVRENDTYAYETHKYDDFIAYLREFGGVFHKRHQINRTRQELINAGLNIYYEALDITDPDLRIYPSPGRFGCTTCAFQDPCLGKNRGDDFLYTLDNLFDKRPHHYYEPPSTDKPGRG